MKKISIKERNSDLYNSDTRSVVINDQLHIFEFDDLENFMHSIYDIKTGKYDTTIVQNREGWDFDGHSMVYIPSQNRLLFVGPYMDDEICSYDINTRILSGDPSWQLSEYGISKPVLVLTNDEKYVIILYFYRVESKKEKKRKKKRRYKNKIEIIDIENNTKWISNVTMPFKDKRSEISAFIVGNVKESGMIINGFIRDC